MFAKTITIVSPLLAEVDAPVPMIVFVITCGVACIASFFIQKSDENKEIRKDDEGNNVT